MRTPSSESVPSPEKPEAIKQALKKPHSTPGLWRENYDTVKDMRLQFPAPVDAMGCNTAKWNEMDLRVRDAYHGISTNH